MSEDTFSDIVAQSLCLLCSSMALLRSPNFYPKSLPQAVQDRSGLLSGPSCSKLTMSLVNISLKF